MPERESPQHLCIGGPLVGRMIDYKEADLNDYLQFNCACGGHKYKWQKDKAKRLGVRPIPSMVWLHRSLFETLS